VVTGNGTTEVVILSTELGAGDVEAVNLGQVCLAARVVVRSTLAVTFLLHNGLPVVHLDLVVGRRERLEVLAQAAEFSCAVTSVALKLLLDVADLLGLVIQRAAEVVDLLLLADEGVRRLDRLNAEVGLIFLGRGLKQVLESLEVLLEARNLDLLATVKSSFKLRVSVYPRG
jgi:hypothetical protein